MNRNRKSQWLAAVVVAVAMMAGSAVAQAGGIGIPLPVESEIGGQRTVMVGHNSQYTLDYGEIIRWMPAPLASGMTIFKLPVFGYEELGLPVGGNVLHD